MPAFIDPSQRGETATSSLTTQQLPIPNRHPIWCKLEHLSESHPVTRKSFKNPTNDKQMKSIKQIIFFIGKNRFCLNLVIIVDKEKKK